MPDHPSRIDSNTTATATPIPRARWRQHPNFGTQVLLLGSHDNFRRISRHLVECAEDREDVAYIGGLFVRWIGAMRSHEAYEEEKLYPYLTRRWAAAFDTARDGHAQLHARCDDVVAAVVALSNATAPTDEDATRETMFDALTEALRAHDVTLQAHLDLEEELVIPLLLQLSAREFHIYTMLPVDQLMQRFDDGRLPI